MNILIMNAGETETIERLAFCMNHVVQTH